MIVAADIEVDLAKFAGKPMYRTSTGLALKKPPKRWIMQWRKPRSSSLPDRGGHRREKGIAGRLPPSAHRRLLYAADGGGGGLFIAL
ncbi:hypothetical protein SODG_005348 [Sodalis praecaptivus]